MLPASKPPTPEALAGKNLRTFAPAGRLQTLLEKAGGGEEDYARTLRSQVRALFQGHIPLFEFETSMRFAVERALTRAWWEGAAQVGIAPDEATDEERTRLYEYLFSETSHISTLGSDILNARDRGGRLSHLLTRVEMWALRYEATRSLAMSIFGQDRKLKWVVGPTEHCTSCLTLNGRVYRASVWNRYSLYPRKRSLECGGFRCRCSFQPTTDRATPGRPPQVA